MSNFTLPVFFILSLAVLTGCSDSSNDQSDTTVPPVIVQPVGEVPVDSDSSPEPDEAEPDGSEDEAPIESESPVEESPAEPSEPTPTAETPSDPGLGSGSGSAGDADSLTGKEVTADAFWDLYSQPGVWRRAWGAEGRSIWRDDQQPIVYVDAYWRRKELYAVTEIDADSAIQTECASMESEQISRDLMFGPLEEDEEPVEGCVTPEVKFFSITSNSLRIENHCEDGSIVEAKLDRISSDPSFAQGTLVFTAQGMQGAALEAHICSDKLYVRDTFVSANGGPPDIDMPVDSEALTFTTFTTHEGRYLEARFTFIADLGRSEGIKVGVDYPSGTFVETGETVDVFWFAYIDGEIVESVFASTSGSVRILEMTDYTARISFNLSGYDGKSVVGEMTVNLQ